MYIEHITSNNNTAPISLISKMDIENFSFFNKNLHENDERVHFAPTSSNSSSTSHICKFCFNKLTIYQINFKEAFKICTNLQCLSHSNQTGNNHLDETCIIKRDVDEADQILSISNEHEYIQHESDNLNIIFNNQLNSQIQKLTSNLEKYETAPNLPSYQPDQIEFDLDPFNFNSVQSQSEPADLILQTQPQTPTTSNLFDDNFFSDINTFLTEDFEVASNDQTYTDLSQFIDLQPIQVDQELSAGSNSQESTLTALKPGYQKPSSSFKTDFLNASYNDPEDSNFELEQILSHSKSTTSESRITISKVGTRGVAGIKRVVNSSEKEVKLANLKVIDEKNELFALIDSKKGLTSPKPVDNPVKSAYKPKIEVGQRSKQNSLLPWEVKTKEYKRKVQAPNWGSPVLSQMPRLENKISRVDLMHTKSNGVPASLKERGSVLKQALLNDNTFLSNLNVDKKLNIANTPVKQGASAGGYKDLVLSVLKKKTNASVI